MYYVYILHSKKDNGLYIGQTENLKFRFKQHNQGSVISTKNRRPLNLIHYESFLIKMDAVAREEYLKSGYGREQLKHQLKNLFKKLNI
jgi:putative endonuclease